MTVVIENAAPCRKRLRVEVEAGRVAGVRAEIVREFCRAASIPGFRPGRAPQPMVERRYGEQIEEELRRRLIPESYREAVAEQKLRVVGSPRIESVQHEPGQPLVYVALVETAPEVALPEYKGIVVKRPEVVVKDEEVEEVLQSLREQQADFVPVEGRGLRMGDFAVIDYTGVAEGKPIAELVPGAKTLGENRNFWLLMEPDSFLPGFCEQLLEALPGERRQVLVEFAADFAEKALAGRKATYFVTVSGIRQKRLPGLDDEFARKLGAESVQKLREQLRNHLVAEAEARVRSQMRQQVVEYLLHRVEFELPDTLLAREMRSVLYDLVRESAMRGASKEQLEQQKEEIFGFALQSARDRLRVRFVLEAIADAERIEVDPAELKQRIEQLAARARTTPQKLEAQLAERGALEELEEELRVRKTLDFLLEHAKLETVAA